MPVHLGTPCLALVLMVGALAPPETRSAAPPPGERPREVALGTRGVLRLGHGPEVPSGRGPWRGVPISLSLRDAPLPEVLRSFAQLTGLNLVVDPRVQGTVTLELKNVPWDQALYVILKTHGLGAELDGRPWLVVTP